MDEYYHVVMIWVWKGAQKVWGNRRGLDNTCFVMCQSGQKIEIEAGLT